MNVVTRYNAVAYCCWLDEKSNVPAAERCYPPIDQIKEGMQMPPDYLSRTGHRLPTFAEWEYAARALTRTGRYFGERNGLLAGYAWFVGNSGGVLHSVGSLKPNAFGLYNFTPPRLVSGYLGPISPVTQWDNIGFRVARTIKTAH